MSVRRIERLEEIDLSSVTCQDLRWRYGTGVDVSHGYGAKKSHHYRNGVMTLLGDVEEHIWYSATEQLVHRNQEDSLLDALTEWEREHGYGRSEQEHHKEALAKYSMRLFDCEAWVDYLPFNRRYRPQVLAQANIKAAVFDCCDQIGEITQAQIDRAYTEKVHCPHCGCWSTFTLLAAGDAPWQDCREQGQVSLAKI